MRRFFVIGGGAGLCTASAGVGRGPPDRPAPGRSDIHRPERYARPPPDDREECVSRALVDDLASMALFGDLSRPQLERVAHTFEEQWFTDGERILRQGIAGSGFYIILEGEVGIDLNGKRVTTLARGQHFGEGSVLLGEPPSADVTALRAVRCLALGPDEMKQFLLDHPTVMYRMLQEEARRFLAADR